MMIKFKYSLIALTCALSISTISSYSFGNTTQPKALLGQSEDNIKKVKVNSDGSIEINGGTAKPIPQQKLSGTNLNLSEVSSNNVPASGNISDSNDDVIILTGKDKPKETNSQNNLPSSDPIIGEVIEYSGGVGKPENALESGVLIFNGGEKNKGNYQKIDDGKTINKNVNDKSEILPIPTSISLDKIPVSVKNMPLPTSLPPLPTENGNVMLPISLPTSEAVALPPLPDFFVPNLGISMGTIEEEGINNMGIPVSPDGKPINYKGMGNVFLGETNKALSAQFVQYMKNAGKKFVSLGIPMTVVVINTDEDEARKFVANNILRSNKNNFESIDIGLTSILSLNTSVNSNHIPVCYIVLKNDQQIDLMNKYIVPLSKHTDEETVAAYLVAHQISHCMDNLERYKTLPKSNTWFPEEAKKVGLSSAAIRRLYPYGMTYNQYSRTTMHLYDDLAQRQYQERIGDIYGIYLTLFAGYDKKISEGVNDIRRSNAPDSAHNTFNAIKNISSDYLLSDTKDVKTLWKSARRLQEFKDVDGSLQFGVSPEKYKASLNRNAIKERSLTEEIIQKPEFSNKTGTENKTQKFEDYNKFGSGSNSKPFGSNNKIN